MPSIRDAFIASLDAELKHQAKQITDLDERLQRLLERARAEVPELSVDTAAFLAHAATRFPPDKTVEASLERLHGGELLLAYACGLGDPAAIAMFRERYLHLVRIELTRSAPANLVDEIAQRLMAKLFVRSSDREPTILKYSGRGKLLAWVEIVARRDARSELRKGKSVERVEADFDRLVDKSIETADPELEHLKHAYRAQFKVAFEKAFGKLTPRERNMLRLEFLDGLTGDQIGAIYGVHKATVTRWRQRARAALFSETKRIFENELQIPAGEFHSVMRLIQSQFDISWTRLLNKED